MQKIDPSFVYHLGSVIRPLQRIAPDTDWLDTISILTAAKDAISGVVDHSIYTKSLRQSRGRGHALVSFIEAAMAKMTADDQFHDLDASEIQTLQNLFWLFESALTVEMQNASIYYVQPKGGFDIETLIEVGEQLFPESLATKVSSAMADVKEGAKALAFHLWTGAGFHLHRANESVLRAYMDYVAPGKRVPKMTMGAMVHTMTQHSLGNAAILAALSNLIQFHRNPLAHPEHTIETQDEAISLYAAIRAAMGYMLDELPASANTPP